MISKRERVFYSVAEVAAIFRVSATTVRRCRGEFGHLRQSRLGGRIVFIASDVDALVQRVIERALAAEPVLPRSTRLARKVG